MILEMIRTMIIWIFSNYIIPPFYKDYWFLLLAFAVILAGRCIYNDIFFGNHVFIFRINSERNLLLILFLCYVKKQSQLQEE